MTDRRRLAFNGQVALDGLRGTVKAARFTAGTRARIAVPVADLRRSPFGPRERQLLLGAPVTVIDCAEGWAFLQAECGYVGYVAARQLNDGPAPTHVVNALATHAYSRPDLKSAPRAALPFGARLRVTESAGTHNTPALRDTATPALWDTATPALWDTDVPALWDTDVPALWDTDVPALWAETPFGYVPRQHLRTLDTPETDPLAIARMFLGVPYLWGGNSSRGLDCSGLIQTLCRACAIACPGDADMQQAELGTLLPPSAPLRAGDIVFWRGHVGILEGPDTLIHANAHAMSVAREPFTQACARIEAAANADGTGGGAVLARRRLSLPHESTCARAPEAPDADHPRV